MNKTITTLLAAAGIAASAPASAVIVDGIDFGALGADPSGTGLETATLAPLSTVTGKAPRPMGSSQRSMATTPIVRTGAVIAVYITLRNIRFTKFTGANGYSRIYGTTVSVFYGAGAPINLLAQDSPTNISTILCA